MRRLAAALSWTLLGVLVATPAVAQRCPDPASALGVSRIVEIDTRGGPLFGSVTRLEKEASFLRRKEVVLTFDDGPMPGVTRPILDVLDRFCIKATFFPVGRMAVAHPAIVKEVAARGHTLGSHTWSHLRLRDAPVDVARDEIEHGFAAVALAAGGPVAPLFRFPGLADNQALIAYLQSRDIGTLTVDVVSNDSFITDAQYLARTALAGIEARGGGILLFHDIKPQTVAALPVVLSGLKERGYSIVHLRTKQPYHSPDGHVAAIKPLIAKDQGNGVAAPPPAIESLGDDTGTAPSVDATAARPPAAGKAGATKRPARPSYTPATDWKATVLRGPFSHDMR